MRDRVVITIAKVADERPTDVHLATIHRNAIEGIARFTPVSARSITLTAEEYDRLKDMLEVGSDDPTGESLPEPAWDVLFDR